ncbi:MAG: hypothetical protein ABI647_20570 [Gemmatimonadota bacterium]
MIALLLNVLVLGGLVVLFGGSVSALRAGIKQRARLRGVFLAGLGALVSLIGIVAVLI